MSLEVAGRPMNPERVTSLFPLEPGAIPRLADLAAAGWSHSTATEQALQVLNTL